MKPLAIPRRTVLRGAGGVALTLPALSVMHPRRGRAAVGDAPRRFVFCGSGGQSIGACYRALEKGGPDFVTPKSIGRSYDTTVGLQTIADEGLKGDMGLVSGLFIPWTVEGDGDWRTAPIPPGGSRGFHGGSVESQVGGTSSHFNSPDNGDPWAFHPRGPSFDQAAAEIIGGETPMRSLTLCLSPFGGTTTLSYSRPDGKSPVDMWGRQVARPISAIAQPSALFNKLFGSTVTSDGSIEAATANLNLRKSILDTVGSRTTRLLQRLGQEDRTQMQRYLDQVRGMEARLARIDPAQLAKCESLQPIPDPPAAKPYPTNPDGIEIYNTEVAWTNETLRGQFQADAIHAAFACDLTRVVSWHLLGGGMNLYPATGYRGMVHSASHDGGGQAQDMARAINWSLEHITRLVKLLRDTPEIDGSGSRMLDNTIIVYWFEGGWGQNGDQQMPAAWKDNPGLDPDYRDGLRYAHSFENMVVIMAGGRNLGLQTGQHIHFNNKQDNRHPARVSLTALRALGYTGTTFGDISGELPEMRKLG